MKTKLIIIALLIAGQFANAQVFKAKAVYKVHRKMTIKVKGNPELQKQLDAQMKKMANKTYILRFNNKESVYQQEQELATPNQSSSSVVVVGNSASILYKNIAKKQVVQQINIFGKLFLVSDSLSRAEWELSDEQKKIGKYNCNKATWTQYKPASKFSTKTNKFEATVDTIVTTAWYTAEIPVSNGPETLYGLPGLILEAHIGKTTILCTEIDLNAKDKTPIEAPKKGKKVTIAEFDKIKNKKIEDMNKRYKNNRKGKDKNAISISITQ